jgi:hypothetical protein
MRQVAVVVATALLFAAAAVSAVPGDSSTGIYDSNKYDIVSGPNPLLDPKRPIVASTPKPKAEEDPDKNIPAWWVAIVSSSSAAARCASAGSPARAKLQLIPGAAGAPPAGGP